MDDYPSLTEATARVLIRLREGAGLSKRKLASLTGIDRVYLLQLEQQKYRLPPGRLVDMIETERLKLLDGDDGSLTAQRPPESVLRQS